MKPAALLLCAVVPCAASAQQWQPGAGCEAFLTVQSNGCYVSNFWTCAEAPEGYVYRAVHENGAPLIADIFDGEFNWIATEFSDGWRETLVHPPRDPISLSGLVETGFNTIDFDLLSNPTTPDQAVTKVRVRGADVMLGETVEIDGESLDKSQYMTTFAGADGVVTGVNTGTQYYSARWDLLFSGVYTWSEDGESTEYDNTPVTFLEPGEDGFGSIQAVHGCDEETVADETPETNAPKSDTAKVPDGAASN